MIRRSFKRKQKDIIIPFCEGETEVVLFAFLKNEYSNKKIDFKKPVNLGGVENLTGFKRTYNKQVRAQGLKPKRDFLSVKFLFIIDNDLEDSEKIKLFLTEKGHIIQQFEPNPEGLLLNMVGKNQGQNLKIHDFRKKCKDNFKTHFGCEAHRLKEKKLKEIFSSENIFKNKLSVLHNLFKAP